MKGGEELKKLIREIPPFDGEKISPPKIKLTERDKKILSFLKSYPNSTYAEIINSLSLNYGSAHQILKKLESYGLIEITSTSSRRNLYRIRKELL